MATKVYKIQPDGAITGLWSDILAKIPGDTAVGRASEVEFDNAQGGWTVKFLLGPWKGKTVPAVFKTREEALSIEAAMLNEWIMKGEISGGEVEEGKTNS